MSYGMYVSAAGAHTQSERLKVISNNLANVDTPGFKREFAIFQARHAEAIERGDAAAGSGTTDDQGGGVQVSETVTDFSGGQLRQTGNPTDMAIDGEGFFLVEKDGEQFVTRAGNFHVAPNGRMMTQQGFQLLTFERQPVAINPQSPWEFVERGIISQDGNEIPLAIVQPNSYGDLAKAGENLFRPLDKLKDVPFRSRHVVNGFLEQSSVRPAEEMMELIETSRVYEANIRMVQNQDQMTSSLIGRILRA